jgi:drug/metabolite transporter (DMT)-like permease
MSNFLKHQWIYSSLIASFCFAGCSLTMGLLSHRGVDDGLIVGGMFAWGALLSLAPAARSIQKHPLCLRAGLMWGSAIGVSAYLGNLLQVKSIHFAANPGYPSAIIGTQIVFVTLIASLWFRSTISPRELVGIGCCLVGLALVVV